MPNDSLISASQLGSKPLLISALDLDLDELLFSLEALPLYEEFAERFDEALQLLANGREMWRPHFAVKKSASDYDHATDAVDTCAIEPEEERSPELETWTIEAVAEVRRKLYNIEQWAVRYPEQGLAAAVRHAGVWEQRATDAQLVAAFGMARCCQAIEVLSRWLGGLENLLREASPYAFPRLALDHPEVYAELINDERLANPADEIEARERAAELLGRGRLALMLAALYQHPSIPSDVLRDISQRAVHGASQVAKRAAKRAGQKSGEARRSAVAERNGKICDKGRALMAQGYLAHEITSIIEGNAVAERLLAKQIRTILREGGVLPAEKKGK
jgi:hypothetical protein